MDELIDKITGDPVLTGGVMALGNFDGVHVGHRAVLSAAISLAHRESLPAYALTFEPHPQAFLRKDKAPFLLTVPEEKRRQIRSVGIDAVISLDFTDKIASMSAEEFIDQILIKHCQVKHIVVGFDFVFGHGREGTVDLLRARLAPHDVDVIDVPPQVDLGGVVISSSRIREALRAGQVKQASQLLGRQFMIQGKVQKGEQRGRLLDYPTANLTLGALMRPLYGAYAVWARRSGEDLWLPGVANLGVRPTFGHKEELFEFHILDFHGSFYGTDWEVCLADFIRPEKVFSNPQLLKEQIKKDATAARKILEGQDDR